MSQKSTFGQGILSTARFYLARLQERLWLKPLISCVLSLLAAFVAGLADYFVPERSCPNVSAESIETLLTIISSSMLVIAVFTVGAMLAAYGSASNSATPRSFPLVVGDAFNAVARDGAHSIEVVSRLQEALHSLTLLEHHEMSQAAISHSELALGYAEKALKLPQELQAVQALAERNMQQAAAMPRASQSEKRSPLRGLGAPDLKRQAT